MKDFWIYTVYKAEFKTNYSVTYSKWQSLVNPAQNQTENKEALPSWVSVESYYLGSYPYHNLLSISEEQAHRTAAFLNFILSVVRDTALLRVREGQSSMEYFQQHCYLPWEQKKNMCKTEKYEDFSPAELHYCMGYP